MNVRFRQNGRKPILQRSLNKNCDPMLVITDLLVSLLLLKNYGQTYEKFVIDFVPRHSCILNC